MSESFLGDFDKDDRDITYDEIDWILLIKLQALSDLHW